MLEVDGEKHCWCSYKEKNWTPNDLIYEGTDDITLDKANLSF